MRRRQTQAARRWSGVKVSFDGAGVQQPNAPGSVNFDEQLEQTDAAAVRQQCIDVLYHWNHPLLQPQFDFPVNSVVHTVPALAVTHERNRRRHNAHVAVVYCAIKRRSPFVDGLTHVRQLVYVHPIPAKDGTQHTLSAE
jgi:hypothetical protein